MYVLATLANKNALKDLKVFFFTLELWNATLPSVYIYCDSNIIFLNHRLLFLV